VAKLITPDGELDEAGVQQRFAQAMAAPEPDEPQAPAPARREPEAEPPAAAAAPDDPKDNKARMTGATRQPRARRTGGKKAATAAAAAPPVEGAYLKPTTEFLEAMVIAGALVPMPAGQLAVKIRLQARLVSEHAGGLAVAIDSAARNNAVIRRGVEALTMGSAGWVLPAVLAVAPFAAASAGLWKAEITEQMVAAANQFQAETKALVMQAVGQAA